MNLKTSQANVWVVGFGVKTSNQHDKKYLDDFAFVLDKDGNSAFVPWAELTLEEHAIISDAYLVEALTEVHDNASSSFGLYHLQPASSSEIADFLVQSHILPLLRDLEIIEHGVTHALQRHCFKHTRGDKAVAKFFKQRFDAVKKIEARIRHEQKQIHRKKVSKRTVQQQPLATAS